MKQPINLLNDEDLLNIKTYIKCYAGNTTSIRNPFQSSAEISHILRFWNENKQFLFELFGNELILEKEVNIQYPEEILLEEMEDVLCSERNSEITFISKMYDFIYELPTEFNSLYKLLDSENLIHNVYNGDTLKLPYTSENGTIKHLVIPKGCKIIKILSKIAHVFNLDGFEEFRLKHSMVLNKKTFKGTICLSIHPLDYMTMSDNDCDWDSCMSWKNEGDYRLGTVEMMNSPYIIVAYLKSKTNMDLFDDGTTEWNNKRWRQLFMVSDKMMFGIKGYPYNDDILTDTVLNYLLELFNKNKPDCSFFSDKFIIKNKKDNTFFDKKIHLSFGFNVMYNDIYGKHLCYITKEFYDNNKDGSLFRMNLSGQTECIICGEDWTEYYNQLDPVALCCPNCSGVMRCPECGDFVSYDEMHELDNGSLICDACFEYYYGGYCSGCGSSFRNSDLIDIDAYGYENDSRYIGTISYCCNCMRENSYQDDIGPIELDDRYGYRVKASNFTEDGFALFGIFNIDKIKEIQSGKTDDD